ncbi:MAG TPA: rhodanese-like domain-containing protein [Terriglobales bacterium]|jgi:rhodanese-related sulfurtransferase|nr:rhodanese-like domain-containing protein [Terriglobales bacterium]
MRRSIVLTGKGLVALAMLLVAVVLAVAAAISHGVTVAETQAAVDSITRGAGQVAAGELAQWIIENRLDYQLIDLREPWQFDDYHIPGAINVPFAQFFSAENLKRLDKNKKIVVYGLGAGQAAQVQLLLAMKGYRSYSLTDGIIGWWDEVLTPTSIRSATPSSSGYQQARQLREYFMAGGRAGGAPAAVTPAPPPVPLPAPSAAAPAKPPAKTPAKAPKKAPPTEKEKEKERLKLGTGCS